jgi:hypothetical protein
VTVWGAVENAPISPQGRYRQVRAAARESEFSTRSQALLLPLLKIRSLQSLEEVEGPEGCPVTKLTQQLMT